MKFTASSASAIEHTENIEHIEDMDTYSREALQADYNAFDISKELGFLLPEPLVSFIVTFSHTIHISSHDSVNFWAIFQSTQINTRLAGATIITIMYCTETFLFTIEDFPLFVYCLY